VLAGKRLNVAHDLGAAAGVARLSWFEWHGYITFQLILLSLSYRSRHAFAYLSRGGSFDTTRGGAEQHAVEELPH
jgi:hypothetical protein